MKNEKRNIIKKKRWVFKTKKEKEHFIKLFMRDIITDLVIINEIKKSADNILKALREGDIDGVNSHQEYIYNIIKKREKLQREKLLNAKKRLNNIN